MKKGVTALILLAALAVSPIAGALEIEVKAGDSIESLINAQKGKRITLRTRSGLEVTGTVKSVSGRLVHMAQLAGKEYYDAIVALDGVEAVMIRTKD